MAAEDKPSSDSAPSSMPPSSSQPLDQSLGRVFGALEQVLTDLTQAAQVSFAASQDVARKVSELSRWLHDRGKLDDKQREAVLSALVKLTESFDKLALQEGIAVGATVEARDALIDAKDKIEERMREITGSHPLLPHDPEGPPRFLQVIVLKITNFGWRNKAKVAAWVVAGASAQPVLLKLKLFIMYLFGAH